MLRNPLLHGVAAALAALACAAPPAAAGSASMITGPEFAAILDVCEAATLDQAAARGGQLGWPAAPDDPDWRTSFERYNGGTVRVVGWRRNEREGDGRLSYWVATGPNAHTACAFSTDRPGVLEALRGRFGPPDTAEEQGDIASAAWRRGGIEVSFTRVGTSSVFNLSRDG